MDERLSLRHARRIALAVQGFAAARPAAVGAARMLGVTRASACTQIDSVNVLRARALPAAVSPGSAPTSGAARRGGVGAEEETVRILGARGVAAAGGAAARCCAGGWSAPTAAKDVAARCALSPASGGARRWRCWSGSGPRAARRFGPSREQARKGWWEWSDAKIALECCSGRGM
jgi:hypothetical protein